MQTEAGRLVIRLGRTGERDEYWWLPAGARHRSVDPGQAARLSQGQPALVLLDADCIRVDRLTLPAGVRPDEVALLLEEYLCEPLEEVEILLLERKKNVALVATINRLLVETLKARLEQQDIRVGRWLPMAVCVAKAMPEEGLLQLDAGNEHWILDADSLSLLTGVSEESFPVSRIERLLAGRKLQQLQLPDDYSHAAIPWLATHLPDRMALWPVRRLQLPQWNPLLLPWLLLLPVLLLLLVLQVNSQQPLADPLQAQLARQLHWQQQRLDAWQSLEGLLQTRTHLRVQLLQLNENGIRVELEAVRPGDQRALQQLPGDWQFEPSRAIWEYRL